MKRALLLAATIAAGLFGLFAAADAASTSGYAIGLTLTVACTLFGFQVIGWMVGGPARLRLLPDRPGSGWATVVVLALLGLAGLFLAASGDRGLYWTGLGLGAASLVLIMRTMKGIFDRQDGAGRGARP